MLNAKEIFLRAKKNVYNSKFGLNESFLKNDGLDFSELKEYENDDLRRINWKATAKTSSLKANVFNQVRKMNVLIVFLLSGSLNFGTFKLKIELGAEILGLLGLSAIYQKNSFFALFLSQNYEKFYAKINSEDQIYALIKTALNFDILGKSAIFSNFDLDKFFDRKGIVFVISDFLDEMNLSHLAFKKDVYAVILRDKFEENPTNLSGFDFIDTADFSSFDANLSDFEIQKYKEILKSHDEKIQRHFALNNIAFGKIYTDEDPYLGLLKIARS